MLPKKKIKILHIISSAKINLRNFLMKGSYFETQVVTASPSMDLCMNALIWKQQSINAAPSSTIATVLHSNVTRQEQDRNTLVSLRK